MSKPRTDKHEDDSRTDIATADDVNIDDDNAIGSPKNSLTSVEKEAPEDPASTNYPGDEAEPNTTQTGELPCERCGGDGQLDGQACPHCGGTGKVVVNVGDA